MKFILLCDSLIREYRWLGKKRKTVNEENAAGGDGSAFGSGATGDHGGDIGNGDWYATGDARVPFGKKVHRRLNSKSKKVSKKK